MSSGFPHDQYQDDGEWCSCEMWLRNDKVKVSKVMLKPQAFPLRRQCIRDKTLMQQTHESRGQKPAAMDSCFGLVRLHAHGTQFNCYITTCLLHVGTLWYTDEAQHTPLTDQGPIAMIHGRIMADNASRCCSNINRISFE